MEPALALARPKNTPLASWLSLVVPGAGQAYLGHRSLGVILLATTLFLAYIIYWSFDTFKIGLVTLGSLTTSWLWLLLGAFWAWNIYEAYARSNHRPKLNLLGLVLP